MAFRDLSAKNSKYDRYHCDLLQWYIKFLIKSLLVVMFKPLFILFIIKTYAHNNSLKRSQEIFLILKKDGRAEPWIYVTIDLNGKN